MTLSDTNMTQTRLNGPIEKSYSRISELTKKTSLDCSTTLIKILDAACDGHGRSSSVSEGSRKVIHHRTTVY